MKMNLTDEEIKDYMNFDDVLSRHQAQRQAANRWIRNVAISVVAGSLVILTYSILPSDPASATPASSNSSTVVADSSVVEPVQKDLPDVNNGIKKSAQAKKETVAPPLKATQSDNATQPDSTKETTPPSPSVQYVQAEPMKGYPDLYDYFGRELQYPEEAVKDSIQGVVSVSFIINTAGRPEQIKIQNSLGSLFDTEAIRLIENMPDWKPAQLNGKAVPAKIALPLTFRIITNEPR